jgi:hypothetical protein
MRERDVIKNHTQCINIIDDVEYEYVVIEMISCDSIETWKNDIVNDYN